MYTSSTHLKDVSIFLKNSIMKTEYWTIGIIVVALGLILYSQVNDSISSHRNFKVNMKHIEAMNDSNRRLSELVAEISKGSKNSSDMIKSICEQNEEIRKNNETLSKQNRLLIARANALTEENDYLKKIFKQHNIELEPAPAPK